ncbi:MAG: Gfo/Idh/MocA family oxidoreductase [Armatimonadaceae bacterium]
MSNDDRHNHQESHTAPIRWGILGCGDVAEKKSGPALYQAEGSELVAVMRRDREKAEDFARRHGAKRAYSTVEELLADSEVDAIYIATPPHLHRDQTIAAAQAGKRVLVEKPMARNVAECEEMIAACREAGVSLHVAYYRRFYPKFVETKRLLESGEIGVVLGARLLMCSRSAANGWRVDPAISGGGHFLDVGSHRLDMLLYLLGDTAEASGFSENRIGHHPAENDVVLALRMASGAVVSAGFHYHTAPTRDVLEIYGAEGTLTFDPFDGTDFTIQRGKTEPRTCSYPIPTPVHLPFIQALVDVYRGSEIPHVTGDEGIKTTRIMEAALGNPGKVAGVSV